jgi:hypothetical protein
MLRNITRKLQAITKTDRRRLKQSKEQCLTYLLVLTLKSNKQSCIISIKKE